MILVSKKDITWNYFGSILNLGMSVFILPAVLKLLTTQELGLWYVFGSVAALVQLMDFGFSPSIMRNISYAWSGAKELRNEGVSEVGADKCPNYPLVASLVGASRKIYLLISSVAGVILLSIGSAYVISLSKQNASTMVIAWIVYSAAVFVNMYSGYWSPMLRGVGRIKETNQAMVVSRATYIAIAVIGLFLGGGLVWLSFSYLISGLLLMYLSRTFFRKSVGEGLEAFGSSSPTQSAQMMRTIWPNAKRQGIVTLGAWMTTRASTLICSSFLGLEVTAQYGLSLQLVSAVGGIAALLFGSYSPELASLKISNQKGRYTKIFSRAISMQWLISILGILAIVFAAPPLLEMIGSNSRLLPVGTLLFLGVVYFLEWNHSTFATLITLSNRVPFVKASILSGGAIVILSFLSVWLTPLGILGLILAQGMVQLAYNNWYWPQLVLQEDGMTIGRILGSAATEFRAAVKSLVAK